jgi:CubicO group peptidase (beta-lactamase class C family)
MKRTQYAVVILVIFPAFLLSSCCQPLSISPPDETPQDEYLVDSLPGYIDQPLELDKEKLAILVEDIEEGEYGKIHSLIIIHYDSLVLEEYFMGWTRHMRHPCNSVTKSFTSALIGIAVEQGYIDGADEKLLGFFPEYDDIENLDTRKESITLENVLTMTAGFEWDEVSTPYWDECGNLDPENDAVKAGTSDDEIKYMLDLPMSDYPGTKWNYNSGGTDLLSGIIRNKTGNSAEEFASENLFSALGITNWEWLKDSNGLTITSMGLYLHPVNMAMLGYLYLKNGALNGKQIVPENWVKESTSMKIPVYIPATDETVANYGYQWWLTKDGYTFYASGYGGQSIFVTPALNLIVVMTADNLKDRSLRFEILDKIIEALIIKN